MAGVAIGAGAGQEKAAWTRDDADDDGTMGFAKTRAWEPENKDV